MRHWFKILAKAGRSWNSDNAFQHSAAVSFYALFSLAPINIIALIISGAFLGKDAAHRQFGVQLTQLVGKASAQMVQDAVTASLSQHGNWISTAVGVVLVLVGATSVFGQLQDSLNQIWGVRTRPSKSGWTVLILQRLLSFAMVLTVGFLLLVSLVITTALTAFVHTADGKLSVPAAVIQAADIVIAFAVVSVLFALFFKVLPDVHLRWRDIWGSAMMTALLFSVGRYLIALYLGHSTVATIYGAAGSLVALLVWVYYSCAIMFFGVEYTRARRLLRGPPLKPKRTAVLVRQEFVR